MPGERVGLPTAQVLAGDERDRGAIWATSARIVDRYSRRNYDLGFDADPGFDTDQTPAYDLTEPEPLPDFNFDQRHGA